MHHAFVVDAEGEKMSKSFGNFANLLDLVDSVDPRAYRMLILQSHYRSPLRVDRATIDPAERAVERLDAFARRAAALPAAEPDAAVLAAFVAKMDADLDTPGAMARGVRRGDEGQQRSRRRRRGRPERHWPRRSTSCALRWG